MLEICADLGTFRVNVESLPVEALESDIVSWKPFAGVKLESFGSVGPHHSQRGERRKNATSFVEGLLPEAAAQIKVPKNEL